MYVVEILTHDRLNVMPKGDAGIDLVRMGEEAGLFWLELHSNVSCDRP